MEEQYKIGDVSEILNLSNEMIRYYEKCGAIKPVRDEKNQYRTYGISDIFSLIDCLNYKNWGIKIKDITSTVHNDFQDWIQNMLNYQSEVQEELDHLLLKNQRINQIIEKQKTFKFNIGNYWVKKVKSIRVVDFVTSDGENFGKITADKNVGKILFSDDYISYFDVCVELKEERLECGFSIEEKYYEKLNFPSPLKNSIRAEQFCLCTIVCIDFQEEKLNQDSFVSAINYAKDKGYKINGDVRGIIVGTGFENQSSYRYFEIQIPIEMDSETI